ncbi:PepSY domain-containing protein [Rubrimonas cliftonensis]|uniref:Peptidase propeptide and YPEB domain-containing protein n=1 Tax=Rubrimonas cliftonensis TaxID=89524 RepID=A0A1H3VI24_9RHOB|nr:PepSY domain-containing protein [Rubrimonas cliftonensis]SDZ74453.1 Peptidase propeptide and YPEB domain-containing protein [Rubrimonas cliftonensis]
MRMTIVAVSSALAGAATAPAFADRAPTPRERTAIEARLQALGFVAWDEIELDDGLREIDDARRADGAEFELELDRELNLVSQRPD